VEKTKQSYVLPTLAYCYFIKTSFDLWMSKGAYDIFPLLLTFWGLNGNQNILQLGFLMHLISLGTH